MDEELQQLRQRIQQLELIEAKYQQLRLQEALNEEFREKLKIMNEINAELGVLDSFDEMCRLVIWEGMNRLGFERLGLWFLDPKTNRMHGTYGIDEEGKIRDERTSNWVFENTTLLDYLNGYKEAIVMQEPIYNNRSEVIGDGWHISVPVLYQGKFIGYMTADNFLTQQPMKEYQPELLRLYGTTIGHLATHQRDQESAHKLSDAIRLKQERVGMLEMFISHVGHDFRTPLTIISTNTYLLNKTHDEARKQEIAQNIQDQVMYMDRVINRMLEVIRLETISGFTLIRANLATILYHAFDTIEALAIERSVRCEMSGNPQVKILANMEWLGRAISEVLKNAVQYTDSGGHVNMDVVTTEAEVCITIRDTGVGIAAEELDKIFNHLYRINQARTDRGVGLGLTLAKLVVEAHGGCILVESTVGKGSTFQIILPR